MTKVYLDISDISALERATTNLRDRLMIRLLFHSGCRISEALALEVSDVDINAGTIRIQHLKSKHNKLKMQNELPMKPGIKKVISKVLKKVTRLVLKTVG